MGELPPVKKMISRQDFADPLKLMENNLGNISAIGGPLHGGHFNVTYNQFGDETLHDDMFQDFQFLGALQTSRINTQVDFMDDSLFLKEDGGADGLIIGGTP